jgi:hypothetical protein
MAISRWQGRGVADARDSNPFNGATIIWVIVAGVLAFAGFLFLLAYAPDMRKGDGGAHPLSKSAVGFSGLYDLARFSGRKVNLQTDDNGWGYTGFYIVTIQPDSDAKTLAKLAAAQRAVDGSKTLYILPKWETMPLATKKGWVQRAGTIDPVMLKPLLDVVGAAALTEDKSAKNGAVRGVEDDEMAGITTPRPAQMRYIAKGLDPVLTDAAGHVVLGRMTYDNDAADYVLADPDLLSNHGLKSAAGADAAIRIVDALRFGPDDSVAFDMVLVSGGRSRNLLQLMFEPPFLAFTIALMIAAILTGLHAIVRFGPPKIEGRAIPFGKRALADNAALLVSRAGREASLGDRYVAVVRDATGTALGAQGLSGDALEGWLDKLPGGFNDLALAARNAPDAASMRDAAAALYQWKKDVTRDH